MTSWPNNRAKRATLNFLHRMPLEHLNTQELFETLWFHKETEPLKGQRTGDHGWLQYHTAKWCGPCQRLDVDAVVKAAEAAGLTVWKIDVDVNDYTSGYCGVRSIPAWQFCRPRSIVATVQESNTQKVVDWIQGLPHCLP